MNLKINIGTKILFILISLITVSILVTAYIGINTILLTGESTKDITSDALRSQAEKFLVQLTVLSAEKNDMLLKNINRDTGNMAKHFENIYDAPVYSTGNRSWKYDDHVFVADAGQSMNSEDEVSSIFIPNQIKVDDDVKKNIELFTYMNYIVPDVLESSPNIVAVWMVGPEGETLYHPNIGLGNIAPPDQVVTEEIFYTAANPTNNPQKEVKWTTIYDDPAGQGFMISAVSPIYTNSGFFGVLGMDVIFDIIVKNIEEYNPIENSYTFLISRDGIAIAMPSEAYEDILERGRIEGEYGADLNSVKNDFSKIISGMKRGGNGFEGVMINEKELYVAYAPLKETDFSLGIVVEKNSLLKVVSDLENEVENTTNRMIYEHILPIGILILILSFVLGLFFSKTITDPIKRLTKNIEEISMGNIDVEVDQKLKESKDEIGALARAFERTITSLKIAMRKVKKAVKKDEEIKK